MERLYYCNTIRKFRESEYPISQPSNCVTIIRKKLTKNYIKQHKTRPETKQIDKKSIPLLKDCEVGPLVLHYINYTTFHSIHSSFIRPHLYYNNTFRMGGDG